MRILPGVVELLTKLAQRDDLVLALLTGDWERGAGVELRQRSVCGVSSRSAASATASTDRRDLPPVAFARAAGIVRGSPAPRRPGSSATSLLDMGTAPTPTASLFRGGNRRTAATALAAAGAERVLADLRASTKSSRALLHMSADGMPLASHADELAADLAALHSGDALVDVPADLLELRGPDRLRLLNGWSRRTSRDWPRRIVP